MKFGIFQSNNLDEQLKKGKSLIHAAIARGNIELLQELSKSRPTLVYFKDENGKSALHYAALLGFLEGVRYLLKEFKLDTFAMDDNGFCPIHIASKNGHIGIVQELLQHCPDATEILNSQGQNILHVAAKNGRDNFVKYVLQTLELASLINEKDNDGNSPLHLASVNWHPKIVSSLTWDKRVSLQVVNNAGLTALEAVEEFMESMPTYRKRLTRMALMSGGSPRGRLQNTPHMQRTKSANGGESYNTDYSKDRVNTLLLVSTLVATVTFAAGFTMPGGYNSSDPNQGMATLVNKRKFQVFVVCNTIAMFSSIIIAVTLIWAQLGDLSFILNALRLAVPLLGISLTMMSVAFMASVNLVVGQLHWLSIVVFVMGMISIVCLLALFVPLYLPYSSPYRIARYVSYYPFCLLMLASGSYDDHEHDE